MEIVIFLDKTFQEIPEQDNPSINFIAFRLSPLAMTIKNICLLAGHKYEYKGYMGTCCTLCGKYPTDSRFLGG